MTSINVNNNLFVMILVKNILKCHIIRNKNTNLPGLFERLPNDSINEPTSAPMAVKELNSAKSEAFPFMMSLIMNGRYAPGRVKRIKFASPAKNIIETRTLFLFKYLIPVFISLIILIL